MSDVGAIGVILFDCKVLLEELNNCEPATEYEYGIQLINYIIDEIEKQGIDLEGDDVDNIYDPIRGMMENILMEIRQIEKQGIDLEGDDVDNIYDLISGMRNRLDTRKSVTSTINRRNYSDVLEVLCNFTEFQYNRDIKLKVILQDGVMTIQMEKE